MVKNHKNSKNLPKHIGFILDGNGRWANSQGLSRNFGHKAGVEAVKRVIKALLKFDIPYVSMFAFSTENWKRSKEEIDGIFALVKELFKKSIDDIVKNDIKINFFGDLSVFTEDLKSIFEDVIKKTENNTKVTLNICLNYGGRADIVRSVNNLIKLGYKSVTEEDISNNLYSKNQPDLDFVIRTSGEMRISNFMIYQLAYAELYFPKVYWPDFDETELKKALKVFAKRRRRYGGY